MNGLKTKPVVCFLIAIFSLGSYACASAASKRAEVPPMGWNNWAQYQCNYNAETVLNNARALVSSGLAAAGYRRVTIDDCWMSKDRDRQGNLVPNKHRFPNGITPVEDAIRGMGLRFGIYEDAGSTTCGGFAGSGSPGPGKKPFFSRDIRQFAEWHADFVKLDGCNVVVPPGMTRQAAYARAYSDASAAIRSIDPKMIFLESMPSYFRGDPKAFYGVLTLAGKLGDLWRVGTDMEIYNRQEPSRSRFRSVLWNYAYTLPLGRYQGPGNWNNPDFIIGGSSGLSLSETRSQLALWAMMSAPLVLSVDVSALSPASVSVLGNRRVIAVDQDPLGKMATLIRRTPSRDVLVKPLSDGDYAVAVLNHSFAPIGASISLGELGFSTDSACTLGAQDLWTGHASVGMRTIVGTVGTGDTAIWRIKPSASCGRRTRSGAIVMTVAGSRDIESFGRCLSARGEVVPCEGDRGEVWTVLGKSEIEVRANGECLSARAGVPEMSGCSGSGSQHWIYTQNGNLVNKADGLCLGVRVVPTFRARISRPWELSACGANAATQTWSLPGA